MNNYILIERMRDVMLEYKDMWLLDYEIMWIREK